MKVRRPCIFKPNHFVVKNWRQSPLSTNLSSDRASCYKIFHVTSGSGLLVASSHHYFLKAGDVAFIRPDEAVVWRILSDDIGGHFCFVHPKFFRHADHVVSMFLSFPYAHPANAVVPLSRSQSETLQRSFELMLQEAVGDYDDKVQAILLHLQMILLKVRRAGKISGGTARDLLIKA